MHEVKTHVNGVLIIARHGDENVSSLLGRRAVDVAGESNTDDTAARTSILFRIRRVKELCGKSMAGCQLRML